MKKILSLVIIVVCACMLFFSCVTKEEKNEPKVCTECFPYPIYE